MYLIAARLPTYIKLHQVMQFPALEGIINFKFIAKEKVRFKIDDTKKNAGSKMCYFTPSYPMRTWACIVIIYKHFYKYNP